MPALVALGNGTTAPTAPDVPKVPLCKTFVPCCTVPNPIITPTFALGLFIERLFTQREVPAPTEAEPTRVAAVAAVPDTWVPKETMFLLGLGSCLTVPPARLVTEVRVPAIRVPIFPIVFAPTGRELSNMTFAAPTLPRIKINAEPEEIVFARILTDPNPAALICTKAGPLRLLTILPLLRITIVVGFQVFPPSKDASAKTVPVKVFVICAEMVVRPFAFMGRFCVPERVPDVVISEVKGVVPPLIPIVPLNIETPAVPEAEVSIFITGMSVPAVPPVLSVKREVCVP